MRRAFQRLLFVVICSFSAWAHGESHPSEGNGQATIPLFEEREYLDRDVLAGDSQTGLAPDRPGQVMNEPGLTPELAEHLSETFLTETCIGSIMLFGLIYRLLIK